MRTVILSLLLTCSFCYFTNPVINADSPDPGVLYYNGYYYLVGTNSNSQGLYVIRKSRDLVDWKEVGVVFTNDDKPKWADGSVS